jgi:hypothetical protein
MFIEPNIAERPKLRQSVTVAQELLGDISLPQSEEALTELVDYKYFVPPGLGDWAALTDAL